MLGILQVGNIPKTGIYASAQVEYRMLAFLVDTGSAASIVAVLIVRCVDIIYLGKAVSLQL